MTAQVATQGTWDPEKRGLYFMAGNGSWGISTENALSTGRFHREACNLFAVNEFAAIGQPLNRNHKQFLQFQASLDKGCPTLLDSGIFYLANAHARQHNISQQQAFSMPPSEVDNFDWLWDIYMSVVDEFGDELWGYVELDLGGTANKRATRVKLEAAGLRPIPVWHPLNDDDGYFHELAGRYDRICFSNTAQPTRWTMKRMLTTLTELHRQYPDLYVHILGLTPNDIQAGLPFDSADSSSWLGFVRWPQGWHLRALGARGLPADSKVYPPVGSQVADEDREELMIAGVNMCAGELLSTTRSLQHWWSEMSSTFQLDRYPDSELTATLEVPR